ncbi:MAG TPA: trypsin-like serine protease [Hyalangium sp.]|jgi:hypothetical protein|nr:trypsin-like serine protease [Hyalangium sp.]
MRLGTQSIAGKEGASREMGSTRSLEPKWLEMARLRAVLVLWVVMAASGCGGCEPRTSPERANQQATQEPEKVPLDIPLEPQFLRLDHRLIELAGELDSSNRYLAAVKVSAMEGEDERMRCGGAVISPRVVLTAGHCVCGQRRLEHKGQTVITGSACYDKAQVETLFYEPETIEGATLRPSRSTTHEGRVQPHPALRIELNSQGRVSSSHADLALIYLSTPVEFAGLPLADEDVRPGETVVIAGHGYDEVEGVFGWERRFSRNQVSRLETAEDERVLIQQPAGHRYRQDSGGPCLRQGAKELELVGISSRWLGEGSAFTSIHGYRDWLREAIQRAEMGSHPEGNASP